MGFSLEIKVIKPTVEVLFFQSVKIQEIISNKYKNTLKQRQIDQLYIMKVHYKIHLNMGRKIEFLSSCTIIQQNTVLLVSTKKKRKFN